MTAAKFLLPLALVALVAATALPLPAMANSHAVSPSKIERVTANAKAQQKASAGARRQANSYTITKATASSVSIAWQPASSAAVDEYRIYVGGKRVGTTGSTSFTITGLRCGRTYDVMVASYTSAGTRVASYSASVATAACPDLTSPKTPTGLQSAFTTTSSATLSWSRSWDNVGVVAYGIFFGDLLVGSSAQPAYTLSGLKCGTSYSVGVDAVDAAGNRSAKQRITVTTSRCDTPPTSPTSFAASSATPTSVTLSWGASSDDSGVAGYEVYRGSSLLIETHETSIVVSGLSCGTSYLFGVDALDGTGQRSGVAQGTFSTAACSGGGGTAAPASVMSSSDTQPPTAPAGLAPTAATTTAISVAWSASTDNVAVSGYDVSLDGAAAGTTSGTSFALTGLSCGTSHQVSVSAFDAAGNRASSGAVLVTTSPCSETIKPSAPSPVTLGARTQTSIAVSWPAATDNVGVVGYGVYKAGSQLAQVSALTYAFVGLTCGQNYSLGVDAVDAAGNRSAVTTVMIATTACPDTTPPTPPAGLAASSIGQTVATITWQASSDNVGTTAYGVYVGGTLVGSSSATSYALSGLTCGSTTNVAIDAVDAAGNRSAKTSLAVSTTACPPPPASPAGVVSLSGTVAAAAFQAAVAAAPAGPVTVQPVAGGSYSVTGDVTLSRGQVTIDHGSFSGRVTFNPGSDGSTLKNSSALGFNIFGADDITVQGNTLDGQGIDNQNLIWDQPAGVTPDRFRITGNTFRHYYMASDASVHAEALYVGYSTNGLIDGNTFDDNGNTSHIFFTWFGNLADPATSYPRNICVKGNTFGPTHTAYYALNFRAEIPASSGIDVEPPPSNNLTAGNTIGFTTSPEFTRSC